MGQILHRSATTTEAIRRAIQNSQASLRELAVRYGINPKTVAKWRRRDSVCDARDSPVKLHCWPIELWDWRRSLIRFTHFAGKCLRF